MGFSLTHVAQQNDDLVLLGDGHFPREHETWVFWYPVGTTAHPYPDYWRRIRVTCSACVEDGSTERCRVQLLLQKGWPHRTTKREYEAYEGWAALQLTVDSNAVSTELTNVELTSSADPDKTLIVSGRVAGRRGEDGRWYAGSDSTFEQDWRRSAEGWTAPDE